MLFIVYLLAALACISTSLVSAFDTVPTPGNHLLADRNPPPYVANNVSWAEDGDGNHHFCRWEGSGQLVDNDADYKLVASDCTILRYGLNFGFFRPSGSWFQVYRHWTRSTSNFTQIASFGSCAVSVALTNGSSASVSILDITSRFSRNSSELSSSYGQMWCPYLPDMGGRVYIGVAWVVGCRKAGAPVTSLPSIVSG
ncbi:hypothetical protein Daus18300_003428 [Diaporthe australafricana]|uniref:Ecp2 effector protein domain-containing protein n=1 Tax=Diaporthe australafricana TaxID=127596 RepID=A0ABR3XGR7_9PEZI